MIDRLVTALRALATRADGVSIADAADAVRLELDCMQQDLTPAQRASLRRLYDALEDASVPDAARSLAARDACETLGIR